MTRSAVLSGGAGLLLLASAIFGFALYTWNTASAGGPTETMGRRRKTAPTAAQTPIRR